MSTATCGGLPVVSPDPIVIGSGAYQNISLLSDLHIGAANIDYDLIEGELEKSDMRSARILLGGDIFDLILPGDKRYAAGGLHPRLQGRDDIVNAAVEWAFEILEPYAGRIDGIGVGNHETAGLRKAHFDAVGELVRRLNTTFTSRFPIAQLGYTSYIRYRLKHDARNVGNYVIWYHHGSGKSGKTHVALGRLIEQSSAFAADLYWSGHSHSRSNACEVMHHCGKDGRLISREVRCVVTGSYTLPYSDQSQADMSNKGRKSNYASEAGYRPHGLGGARVRLEFDKPGFPSRVEVTQ